MTRDGSPTPDVVAASVPVLQRYYVQGISTTGSRRKNPASVIADRQPSAYGSLALGVGENRTHGVQVRALTRLEVR
jgi:hypothetical protein